MLRLFCFFVFSLACALPATAQDQHQFDVRFRGVPVANITVAMQENASAYALAGQVRATRLAGIFATIRFDMSAQGRLTHSGPAPERYVEQVDTGRRQSEVELTWSGGTPRVIRQVPQPRPEAVAVGEAIGTIDPLTALWQVLRDRGEGALCNRVMQVYDGARRSQLGLGPAVLAGPQASCDGAYRRLAGFTQADMQERQSFAFTAHYSRRSGVWRLTEVEASSLYGPIRIVRRD